MEMAEIGAQHRSLLFFLVLTSSGCAKVGDPLPPLVRIPDTIQDLGITQVGNVTRLDFALPSPDIEWVEIYRHCNPAAPVTRFELMARVHEGELNPSEQPGFFTFVAQSQKSKVECRYALRFLDKQGQSSDFSNVVQSSASGN